MDYQLQVSDFSNLELPITVDFFGKNESIVIVQFVDLQRQINFIKSDIYDLEHINKISSKKVLFLVSSEPDKQIFPQQHYLWTQARSNSAYKYTDLTEVDRIHEYAKEHGVLPV